ncbi:uncharacterized protein [Procambarus clarkii]|uniref:uncharacterized protein isoform X2 n=1 Tax=Procambarus clarkii TaxID=6728 RepID=UPI003744A2A3
MMGTLTFTLLATHLVLAQIEGQSSRDHNSLGLQHEDLNDRKVSGHSRLGNSFPDNDYQNPDFYKYDFENTGFQNPGLENHGFQNPSFQNPGLQNPGFQNPGLDNNDFQNPGFGNDDIERTRFDSPDVKSPGESVDKGGNAILNVDHLIVRPGNLTCYSCKLDFRKSPYEWDHPCLGRHNGRNVSDEYLVACGLKDIYCRVERTEVNGVLITLTRECTDVCYFGCRPKGFGISQESCAKCCSIHACNHIYPLSWASCSASPSVALTFLTASYLVFTWRL